MFTRMIYEPVTRTRMSDFFFAGNLRGFNSILLRADSENKLAPRFSALKPRVRRTGN